MLEIRVAGGFSDSAEIDIMDRRGADLASAVILGCLVAEDGQAPSANDPAWKSAQFEASGSAGVVSLLIDGSYSPGHYDVALQLKLNNLVVLVWVVDPEHPERRAHVYLT